MPTKQGNLALLNDPIAQELLQSNIPARLAYVWSDGTPRVIPIWFHWTGQEIVLGTPAKAPKTRVLQHNPKVALTIDSSGAVQHVLLVRGVARVQIVDGVVPEYALAAERYMGREGGQGWVAQVTKLFPKMARIAIQPEWVGILDFEKRLPSAIEIAMAGA
jgi:hypothetical protein